MTNPFLNKLVGSWEGTARTWFRPGPADDESIVTGEFQEMLGGQFLRHRYTGEIQGQARTGEETIAFNSVTKRFQTAWVDSFHMNYAIMFSEGEPSDSGFAVLGKYEVEENSPVWSWRTVFALSDEDHLTITAFNISPDGEEAKAVETQYVRR